MSDINIQHAPTTILTSYYKPKPGGLCKRYFRAIQALLERGHTVHYLSCSEFPIRHPKCIHHKFIWPNDDHDTLTFWCAFYLLAPLYLLYISFKHKPTHAFSFHPSYGLLLKIGTLFRKVSHTIFFRADSIKNHKIKRTPSWVIKIDSMIEGLAIRRCQLVFISKACRDGVLQRHKVARPNSVSVLYNDLRTLSSTPKPKKSDIVRLSSVGILEPRKNQELIIHALAAIKQKNYTYNLYGVGSDSDRLRKLIKDYQLEDHITLQGWEERDEIWSKTDVLLLPSLHEGVSNALLEAIERTVAILASDIPEHREILDDSSLAPLQVTDWSERLTEILSSEEKKHLLIKKQQQCTSFLKFNWDERSSTAILDRA